MRILLENILNRYIKLLRKNKRLKKILSPFIPPFHPHIFLFRIQRVKNTPPMFLTHLLPDKITFLKLTYNTPNNMPK